MIISFQVRTILLYSTGFPLRGGYGVMTDRVPLVFSGFVCEAQAPIKFIGGEKRHSRFMTDHASYGACVTCCSPRDGVPGGALPLPPVLLPVPLVRSRDDPWRIHPLCDDCPDD